MLLRPTNCIKYLWKELHQRALYYKGKDDSEYLANLYKKINRISTCDCYSHFKFWCEKNPPDFKNYFEWTVKLHNNVNKIKNKKQITLEEAYKIYK